MTERIYDAIKAILFLQFPKNSKGVPAIYDRTISNWISGERGVIPDNLSIVISGQQTSESDDFYGYRLIEYSFSVKLYAGGDDADITLRIATEGSRIIRNILNQHKRMWVMDLCPICQKLPTSPEHFFVDDEHTQVFGVYGTESGPTGPAGGIYNSFTSTWLKTHPTSSVPGNLAGFTITNGGGGYASSPTVLISGGGFGASGASAVANVTSGSVYNITVINEGSYYTAIPTVVLSGGGGSGSAATAIIERPSPAGIGVGAFYNILESIRSTSIYPSGLSEVQKNNFYSIIRDGVFPIRLLFDIQITNTTPSDEFVDKALFSTGEISLKMKELLPVEQFGPNFTATNYNPQEALG